MAEEGTLASAAAETRIPDSIREVLNARLRYLSEAAVEALTTAAVAGRSFGRDLLGRIQSGEATDLDSALEEGLNAQVIEEGSEPGRFRFSHALMRDTLLAQLSEARRNALHGEIGSALLGLHRESDEQPRDEELAYHFGASAAANPGARRAVAHFSFLAGERAAMQSAWSDAARQFRACLEFLERVDDPAELDAADVHLAASRAERLQGDTRAAFRNGMSALSAYVERGDGLNAARAAITATAVDIAPDRRTPIIAQALEALNGADPALEARLLLQRAGSLQADPSDEAREHVATGRAWAADQQAPVELGRMLVTDAALANEEGRALDGLHDLDRAAELFAQHDAGLYVEDVIRLKLELQARPPASMLALRSRRSAPLSLASDRR